MIASVIIFFIIFGVLVTSHEFGHFIIAKSGGIRVNEFFVGMGPTIWRYIIQHKASSHRRCVRV